jgi:hypothetical protein
MKAGRSGRFVLMHGSVTMRFSHSRETTPLDRVRFHTLWSVVDTVYLSTKNSLCKGCFQLSAVAFFDLRTCEFACCHTCFSRCGLFLGEPSGAEMHDSFAMERFSKNVPFKTTHNAEVVLNALLLTETQCSTVESVSRSPREERALFFFFFCLRTFHTGVLRFNFFLFRVTNHSNALSERAWCCWCRIVHHSPSE